MVLFLFASPGQAQTVEPDDRAWTIELESRVVWYALGRTGLLHVETQGFAGAWRVTSGELAWRGDGLLNLDLLDSTRAIAQRGRGLVLLDPETGQAQWSIDTLPWRGLVNYIVSQGNVLVGFGPLDDRVVRVVGIDLSSGRILWLNDSLVTGAGERSADRVRATGYQLALPDTSVIMRLNRGTAIRIDSRTGALLWRFDARSQVPLGEPSLGSPRPMVVGSTVWADGGAFSVRDGRVVWPLPNKSWIVRLDRVPGGLLVTTRNDLDHTTLRLMDTASIQELWPQPVRIRGTGVTVVRHDTLVIAVDGGLAMHDLSRGTLLRQHPLPDFTSKEEPATIEFLDGDYLLESSHNLMRVSASGEIAFHLSYGVPSVGLNPLGRVVFPGYRNPENLTYVHTSDRDLLGQKGIVLLDRARGRELGTVRRKDRAPGYVIDPMTRMAVGVEDRRLTGYRFRSVSQ
jgi:outer membrane protein assembly factor BamB